MFVLVRTNFILFYIKFQRNNLFFKVYLHFLSGLNNIFCSGKRLKKNSTLPVKLIDNGRKKNIESLYLTQKSKSVKALMGKVNLLRL